MEQFSSPQEEIAHLKEQILHKEEQLRGRGETPDRDAVIYHQIDEHKALPQHQVLAKGYRMIEPHVNKFALELAPEDHDDQIEALIALVEEKGIRNALEVVESMRNAHIEDDFHRYLVEYLRHHLPAKDFKEKTKIGRALKHTLFEVSLPEARKDERERSLKELISGMEQFYSGMLSVADSNDAENYFAIELALSEGSDEFIFYVSVPDSKRSLFEKQMLSVFPFAKLIEKKDDYNIFSTEGVHLASVASQSKNPIYPIKTYEQFDHDPLNVLINAFSKLKKDGEGASFQLLLQPKGDYYVKRYREALSQIMKGTPLKKAIDIQHTFLGELGKGFKEMAVETGKDLMSNGTKKEEKPKPIDDTAVENIKHKISAPILNANMRIVVSAKEKYRAEEVINEIESSFNQFQNTLGNSIVWKRIPEKKMPFFVRDFSFRIFEPDVQLPLSIAELTTLLHFPGSSIFETGQLKQAKAGTAAAPLDIPFSGMYLGTNRHRNHEVPIYMSSEDRLRHFYVIGQTGTGKTTLLRDMIIQDIENGEGVCFIDPHGSDVQDILARVPKERYEDVIYFDPSNIDRPMGMNMLEYDPRFPEQKIFVVNELFSIFEKLFDMKTAGGPMFEQYFRNATMLVLEDPESGNTLVDVSRVLTNKAFRDLKISRCRNPIVSQFWTEVAGKAGGEASLSNIVPYITSKFDVFLANDIMRPIIAQEKSAFNFRDIMDSKKIFLVNLSKGRLGDMNANLIGLILVGKILMAALSRVDSLGGHGPHGSSFPPFYLYIDEFQNITTNSISTILSEARKYKLSLHIAHQFIAQLRDEIKDAVFGNVGSIVAYRVGAEDAEYLERQFGPTFSANDLMNIDNLNCYAKLLINGKPARPFNIEVPFPPKVDTTHLDQLKQLSALKYGRDRAEIEEEIARKYRKEEPKPEPKSENPFADIKL
jgi:hypothetical protein